MKYHTFVLLFGLLTTTIGCGDDIAGSSNRRRGQERSTQNADGDEKSPLISSQMHRLRASAPILSYAQEIEFTIANNLPSGLRRVPDMEIDDEGRDGKNVVTMNSRRPSVTCGVGEAFSGIDGRITDCNLKNGSSALWNGYLYGAAGEGTWKLVALTSTGREIWQDVRTGMVWSDIVGNGNWCKAAGNSQEAMTGVDTDCSVLSEGDSLCVGTATEGFGTTIQWRLPTRNDYLQGDINGLRFVLKKGAQTGFWTATLDSLSSGRTQSWVYHPEQGTLSSQHHITDRQVRCIGAPVN